MKKQISAIAAATLCFAYTVPNIEATGETIRYYDVAAYINNYPIKCFNINDYCGIYVRDLENYGFNVFYDESSATVNVTRDTDCTSIAGMGDIQLPYQREGTVYKTAGESSIKVFLDGEETPSFWVDGNMMILIDNMAKYGKTYWDNNARAFFLTLPELPKAEYVPLQKAKREYTRVKTPSSLLDFSYYSQFPTEEQNWGFTRVEHDEPILYDWQKSMLEKFNAEYIDHSRPHAVYLTFDEGYEAGYTAQILDILEKYNIPATFFVTGEYLDSSPDLVKRMIDNGFSVGNHTLNHKNLAQSSTETIIYEIEAVSDRLKYDFGYETYYMRPPEGAFNEKVLAIAKDMGYNTILWSFAYYDYDVNSQPGTDTAYDMITRYMHDGAIYLLHAVSADNAAVLESVIQYALDNGYEFRSLDDLCQP